MLKEAVISIKIQDAYRLVELVDAGTFPASAFLDGRGTSYDEFKKQVLSLISSGVEQKSNERRKYR